MGERTENHFGPFLYVWLAVSTLLNVSGMASIVEGLVIWTDFLKQAIDLYRVWIRDPISWTVHLVWPAWWPKIPAWVFDWACVSAGFLLAVNVFNVEAHGRTLLGTMISRARDPHRNVIAPKEALVGVLGFALLLVLGPLMVPAYAIVSRLSGNQMDKAEWRDARRTYVYWVMIIAIVVLLIFLNWQLKRAAVR
jgi:hypothetical protein